MMLSYDVRKESSSLCLVESQSFHLVKLQHKDKSALVGQTPIEPPFGSSSTYLVSDPLVSILFSLSAKFQPFR